MSATKWISHAAKSTRRYNSVRYGLRCLNSSATANKEEKAQIDPSYGKRKSNFIHAIKAAILGSSVHKIPDEPTYEGQGKIKELQIIHHKQPFRCQYGGVLPELQLAYETWGTLNSRKDNVILLQHGLSASSHARSHLNQDKSSPGWWENFIGPSLSLDTDKYYVICMNHLGSCYGTTGPSTINPKTEKPYGGDFPIVSIADMLEAQFLLLDHLEIEKVHAVIGASLGGNIAFLAGALFPNQVGRVVSISAGGSSPPIAVALRYLQRCALMSDPKWNDGHYYESDLPVDGMALARKIATITYRGMAEWDLRFQRQKIDNVDVKLPRYNGAEFMVEDYIRHQGESFLTKTNYDPNSLIYLLKAMDIFEIGEGMENSEEGFSRIKSPTLILGASSDILYPPTSQQEAALHIQNGGNPDVICHIVESHFGHDTFLIDTEVMGSYIKTFLGS